MTQHRNIDILAARRVQAQRAKAAPLGIRPSASGVRVGRFPGGVAIVFDAPTNSVEFAPAEARVFIGGLQQSLKMYERGEARKRWQVRFDRFNDWLSRAGLWITGKDAP